MNPHQLPLPLDAEPTEPVQKIEARAAEYAAKKRAKALTPAACKCLRPWPMRDVDGVTCLHCGRSAR